MTLVKSLKPSLLFSTPLLKKQSFLSLCFYKASPTLLFKKAFSYKGIGYKQTQRVQPFTVLAYKANPDKSSSSRNILQIINGVEKAIAEKQLIGDSRKIVCTLSGGQDSIFLAFCLSFLQLQKSFTVQFIWCNHFWQSCSFYTTFHLTKCAVSFSSPILGFLPSQTTPSLLFYKSVIADWNNKKKCSFLVSRKKQERAGLQINLSIPEKAFFLSANAKIYTVERERSFTKRKNHFALLWRKTGTKAKIRPLQVQTSFVRRFCGSKKVLHTNLLAKLCFALVSNYQIPYKSSICMQMQIRDLQFLQENRQKTFGVKRFGRRLDLRLTYKCKSFELRSYKSKICMQMSFANKSKICKHLPLRAKICKKICMQSFFITKEPVSKTKTLIYRSLHLNHSRKTKLLLFYKKVHRHKGYKKRIEKRSEAQARNWRHITIERGSTFYESKPCMYGHTGSDRVETILFNLIRGSGRRAPACLPWKQRYSQFCYNNFYPSYKQVIKKTHLRHCYCVQVPH